MKLKTKYVPLNLMIAEVKGENVIRKVKGVYQVCAWPKFDKDRVLSENEIFVRNKFSSVSKKASCHIQDPVLKNIYNACAKPWQSGLMLLLGKCTGVRVDYLSNSPIQKFE